MGIGRTLHNSRVEWWQHLGFGSVAYIFALALLLWLVLAPFCLFGASYRHILTVVALTSPTKLIYAVPVEAFLSHEQRDVPGFIDLLGTVRLAR